MSVFKAVWSSLRGAYLACNPSASRAEGIVRGIFYLTCLQVVFLTPYVVIIPGERSNVFSGLLCAVSLLAAWLVVGRRTVDRKSPEIVISIVLTALVVLSGLFSSTPGSSSARGFVVLASGLGGFWCARILLASEEARRFFQYFSLVVLGVLLALCLAGYLIFASVERFVDVNAHPLADRILLLWFAPLSLLFGGSVPAWGTAVPMLCVSYLVFYLSNLRSAILIPLVLALVAVSFGALRLRHFLVIIVLAVAAMAFFFQKLPTWKMGKEFEPAYYRVENYLFSWHVALKHPWLGIGLRAPREEFLADYQIKYPYTTKEKFTNSVRLLRTSENTFLTFMAELGFPFLILYTASLVILLKRLIRSFGGSPGTVFFHPLALLLPITAGILHFQVLDGLLLPQISWFFHILLGLIPFDQSDPGNEQGKQHSTGAQ
jgi:hypothetical protein